MNVITFIEIGWKVIQGVPKKSFDKKLLFAFKFGRKTAIKFQKCFYVILFQEFVTEYHLE